MKVKLARLAWPRKDLVAYGAKDQREGPTGTNEKSVNVPGGTREHFSDVGAVDKFPTGIKVIAW